MFADDLRQSGWTETARAWEFAKGDWHVWFDTSSWMVVETKSNPRVFDVPVPAEHESAWTVHLIEHLCKMEDERHRLREVLERIRDDGSLDQAARLIAADALEQCYHTWLVHTDIPMGQPGRVYCRICGIARDE